MVLSKNIQKAQPQLLIGLAGDSMLGRLVNKKISATDYRYPWGNLLPLLKKTDLNIINLETTFTTSNNSVPKTFNFKADPDKVQCLTRAHIQYVTLANNHILDFSNEGLMETLKVLNKAKIKHVGAGKNDIEAQKPLIIRKNGIKIGLLGYTDNEPDWEAQTSQPGINYLKVGDIEKVKKSLIPLREKVDLLIVSLHWGPNMKKRPSPEFVEFAHQLIELGADIIHGHSAHIFQGIELYQNGLIFYDTGDFIDDYAVSAYLRNDRSFFFLCSIEKSGVKKVQLVPVFIRNMQVNKAKGEEYKETVRRMKKLSAEFGTHMGEKGDLIQFFA
ncbi:CapA family protein [Echinicola jeungdonensis]|uniref:CapA family protein n=1 Tax=Echinicola jeungdonensis TaxID=709343 RepID=A0ABV5J957_9BACT|nr:CapA family protein [Echinicola jeungdonensis]MDN3670539.1 CapA family protein [Echinicola jeungdonensis]